jgi:hypothetical protein
VDVWKALVNGLRAGPFYPILPDAASRRALDLVCMQALVGVWPGGYCPPRHPTHFQPSSLESNGTLRRGEQHPTGLGRGMPR